MQISGTSAWDGFIDVEDFVGRILDVVLESWPEVHAPTATESEDVVTQRLCARIRDSKTFRTMFLRVYPHLADLAGDGSITGIPDIRFETNAPQHDGEFFVFECKRLRYEAAGKCRSNNSQYIDGGGQGMTAFVNGKYKTPHGHGGMIGYVLCRCRSPISSLEAGVRQSKLLGLKPGDGMRPSSLRNCPEIRESFHQPAGGISFRLHHVFLDSAACTTAP